jgi:formate hydrogenlyase subunit 3/multisubunit Na+/H+ antiporter MnhD subunit
MSAVAAAVLALLALTLPFGQSVGWLAGLTIPDSFSVLGRLFLVEPADRLALAFMFAQAALLFLVSSLGDTSAGLYGAGLAILGLLAAALLVRPFVFAALFIQLAAALAVFLLAGGRPTVAGGAPAVRGALRYLVYTTLGIPFVLLTGWLIEAAAASPGDTAFTAQATTLLMAGFAILLAVAPFHSWLPVVAQQASPFAAAFVFSVMRHGIVFLLLTFLNAYPWLSQNPVVYRFLTLVGGGMALLGALSIFGQHNLGRVMGYVMLVEVGAVMLGIGLGTLAGVQAALAALAMRGLALPLWAAGLDHLRRAGRAAGGDDLVQLRGAARRHPIPTAAVYIALASLAGFPLTAGFVARWSLLYQLAQIHPTAAIFLLVSLLTISLVVLRSAAAMLAAGDAQSAKPSSSEVTLSPFGAALYALGFAVIFVVGLFPQWLLPAVAGAASAFAQYAR